jgi:molecular chaperone DnaK
MPQVEVTFDIDANGILHVTARDKTTGKEQKIRIEASSGLSDAEVDRMVKDAEKNAAEDKRKREEIDTRNRLDTLAYQVEKESKEWSDKIPADVKTRLDGAVERARKAHRGEDMNEIKAALEELTAAFQAAGQAVYAAQSAPAPGPAPRSARPPTPRRMTSSRPISRSWTTRRRKGFLLQVMRRAEGETFRTAHGTEGQLD